jgi:hypothetical protein
MYEGVTLYGSTNSRDDRKNNNNKERNYLLQYHGKEIIQRGTTLEEEYEKFFTLLESPRKSMSSSYHTNAKKNVT